jgi:hypothetical protein
VDRPLRGRSLSPNFTVSCRAAERSIHRAPRPLCRRRAQTSGNGIVANIVHLRRKLFTSLVVSQPVIKVAFLPREPISPRVKMLPITDDTAHRLVTREREQRVDVIRHQKE